MIQSKADLREYMEADRIHLGYEYKKPKIRDIVWRYEIYLRKSEYYNNVSGGVLHKIAGIYCKSIWTILGLMISHIGTIVVNHEAKIGENCRLHVCVNIGTGSPQIGNNVYIGPGAKIFGKIRIANGIKIGANAVVNKDFYQEGKTIVGVPAKYIE